MIGDINMSKKKCEICGVEVNLFQQQKLSDGNYICPKTCRAKGFKDMDYVHATTFTFSLS